MRRLITLAIVAAAAYFGYTELLPRVRSHQESRAAEAQASQDLGQALHCLSIAETLNSDLSRELLEFARPPVDSGTWSTFMVQASSQLSSADSACRCPHEACTSAAAALLEQRRLLNQFDAMVRGTSAGIANPAVAQERIQSLLARARTEAR